jgi:hypothetical protein
MGQLNSINKLSNTLLNRIVEMLKDPSLSQLEIVALINKEAGKKIISKSSLNRFILNREKITGLKRGTDVPSGEASLLRIAVSLEHIVTFLKKRHKQFLRKQLENI